MAAMVLPAFEPSNKAENTGEYQAWLGSEREYGGVAETVLVTE